jgi:hypothetical protein
MGGAAKHVLAVRDCAGANGGRRRASVMKNTTRYRGLATVRYRDVRVSGRREYGSERAEAGAGMNRN